MELVPSRYRDGVVARIVSSADGGPLRRIISGRAHKPTGAFVSIKAGSRAMPWESFRCELPTIQLAEIGSPIIDLLSQPHRLELFVRGRRRPLLYFPDIALTVEQGLFNALKRKIPFGEAVLRWSPGPCRGRSVRKVILEVKDDDDPRNDDKEYKNKLRLAAQVYRKVGMGFFVVTRSCDLECVDLGFIQELTLDRYTALRTADFDDAVQCVLESGGASATYSDVVSALGGGAVGRAKAVALHVRRAIAMDIMSGLHPGSAVRLVQGASTPTMQSPGTGDV